MYLSNLWNFGLRITGHLKKARFMPFLHYILYIPVMKKFVVPYSTQFHDPIKRFISGI